MPYTTFYNNPFYRGTLPGLAKGGWGHSLKHLIGVRPYHHIYDLTKKFDILFKT